MTSLDYLMVGLSYVVFICLAQSCTARADDKAVLPKCEAALSACDDLQHKQADQILVLKDGLKIYKKRVSGDGDRPALLYTIVAGTLGGAAGGQALNTEKGMAVGGLIGGLVGLVVGLVVGAGK